MKIHLELRNTQNTIHNKHIAIQLAHEIDRSHDHDLHTIHNKILDIKFSENSRENLTKLPYHSPDLIKPYLFRYLQKNLSIEFYHRFLSLSDIHKSLDGLITLTTVSAPESRKPQSVCLNQETSYYVVPCEKDKKHLIEKHNVLPEMIKLVHSSIRSSYQPFDSSQSLPARILILTDDYPQKELNDLEKLLTRRYSRYEVLKISLRHQSAFQLGHWEDLLKSTAFAFYLTKKPFDWPYLFLEMMVQKIPCVYTDEHFYIKNLLKKNLLNWSQFLVHLPNLEQLKSTLELNLKQLNKKHFESHTMINRYLEIYDEIKSEMKS